MGQRTAIAERHLELRASDGAPLPAFVAEPQGADAAPRIVIAAEIFGLTPWVRDVARRLAHDGFRTIAPEIFTRDKEPFGGDRAAFLARMQRLDMSQAVRDLRSALDALGGGKAGVIGFCLGGSLALVTAAGGGIDGCVSCYGAPRWRVASNAPQPIEAARTIACPVLALYGKRDTGIPVEAAEELRAALPKGSELVLYDAGHAFLNETRPEMYVPDAASLAWPRITGFFRRTL